MMNSEDPDKMLRKARFFYQLIYEPSYCNFPESRKKNLFFFFLFYPPTLNIICFVEKK